MKGLDTEYHEEDIDNSCLTKGCPNKGEDDFGGYCYHCERAHADAYADQEGEYLAEKEGKK